MSSTVAQIVDQAFQPESSVAADLSELLRSSAPAWIYSIVPGPLKKCYIRLLNKDQRLSSFYKPPKTCHHSRQLQ